MRTHNFTWYPAQIPLGKAKSAIDAVMLKVLGIHVKRKSAILEQAGCKKAGMSRETLTPGNGSG